MSLILPDAASAPVTPVAADESETAARSGRLTLAAMDISIAICLN